MVGDLSPLGDVEQELADANTSDESAKTSDKEIDCAALRTEVTILEKQNTALRVDIGRLRASKERWKSIIPIRGPS